MRLNARKAAAAGGALGLVLAGLLTAPSSAQARAVPRAALNSGNSGNSVQAPALVNHGPRSAAITPHNHAARTVSLPYANPKSPKALIAAAGVKTIQTWNASVYAGQNGQIYPFTLVGKDVRDASATPTTVKTMVIPVVLTISDTGEVFDPTVANTACGETQSDLSGTLNGPIFKNHAYQAAGLSVGKTQYIDALQREQFWSYTNPSGTNPNYHVKLKGASPVTVYASASGWPEYSPGTCQALPEIDINTWDSFVQGTLMPLVEPYGVTPKTFPVFLVRNVVFTDGGCCILGYHSAYNNPDFGGAAQTYSTSEYDTTGDFGATAQDNTILSHEVAEWANDPYINNATPSWGHIGQVSGCQGNLEVGDPLTGSTFPVKIGGIQYHLQELAYFGWFFDWNAGPNGWYSTNGTFTSGATLCS
jgi:hypothetical protein